MRRTRQPRIAVEPAESADWLRAAVRDGGGEVVATEQADGLVWGSPRDVASLRSLLDRHPVIDWVQLPWAGVEEFEPVLDHERLWTCGKGVYAAPVAELALALGLAGFRHLGPYARAGAWSAPAGRNLLGAEVVIVGGGGITESLVRLLQPWRCRITVVRRRPLPMVGVDNVVGTQGLVPALGDGDLIVLALALTPDTDQLIGPREIAAMRASACLVNVARGRHIVTDALVDALREGRIAAAGLDVTDPEPLPPEHPLWSLPNCIVTPHTGNTPEMAVPLLSARVRENVARYAAGEPLLGPIDVDAGY